MSRHWFKPKAFGYGAAPANWQGWVATIAFAVLVAAVAPALLAWQANPLTGPSAWEIAVWLLATAGLTGLFIALARAKTDGQWAWRWGK